MISMFTPLKDAIRPTDKLVTCVVPTKFNLILDDGRQISVDSGTQELPTYVANHHYAKANGVETYGTVSTQPVSSEAAPSRRGRPPKSAAPADSAPADSVPADSAPADSE